MPLPIDINTLLALHTTCITTWKTHGLLSYQHQGFYQLVEKNHAFNYQLWHTEDKARRDDMGYEFVYHAKREIDAFNQQRNNCMEVIDAWLFNALQPEKPSICPINSESPGMIIDRLSILSLKAYHMNLQTQRQDVEDAHRKNCADKLQVIQEQLSQLALSLEQLLHEVCNKTRSFRVYHQFKMYNDPALNPELY